MSRQRQSIGVLVLAAAVSAASASAGDEWDDFHITIDPSSPTNEDTFDLRAFRWFPDSGYLGIDQSISVSGNQIDVRALVQDQHTRPGSVFLTVMTPVGAFFNDFGPLTAGTYHVNAEIWLTPWPSTSGGYLYDEGSLQFTVTGVGAHETPPGDFNGDNVVDASDYVVWRRTDGTPESYETWRSNFGATAGNGHGSALGTPSQPAVPEPAGAILLLSWAALGAWTRRQTASRLPKTH